MANLTSDTPSRHGAARFRQADLERIFKAAKKVHVRARAILRPNGEIEVQMLTDAEAAAQGPSNLRQKVFGDAKA